MLRTAVEYPLAGEDAPKTLLVGGALVFGAALVIVPVIPVQGYLQGVLRASAGDGQRPVFEDWGTLVADGAKALVVVVGYGLAGTVAAIAGTAVLTVAFVVAAGTDWSAVGITGLAVGGVVAVGGALGATAATYLLPAALARLALEDDLETAIEVRRIAHIAYDRTYLLAWLVVGTVGVACSLVASLLTLVLVGFVGLFYVQVVSFHLFGQGYAAGADGTDPSTHK